MSDNVRRWFDKLAQEYAEKDRCPDYISRTAIEFLAHSHSKMARTQCQWCGEECRQFPWLLDEPSTCKVCHIVGAAQKGLPRA